MSDAWLTSLLCRPPKILGRRLQPFSLAHSFILERAENPFLVRGKASAEHLFEAVEICSRTWEQNAELFADEVGRKFRRWVAGTLRKLNEADVAGFSQYIADYSATAPREDGEGGREMASPWQFRIVTWLMERGVSESAAWNMSVGRALCYFDAAQEMEGAKYLVPQWRDDALELIAVANKLREDGRKEDAAKIDRYVQDEFNRHNNAMNALKELTHGQ